MLNYAVNPKKFTPHEGQKKGIKFLLEHGAAGIFADPGVGKTCMVLGAFKILKQKRLARKMLIIAPLKPCYLVWPLEIKKWLDFNHFTYRILHGPKKDQYVYEDADIHIINPEGLDWLFDARVKGRGMAIDKKAFEKLGYDIMCIDELSKFKNISAVRSKILKLGLDTFKRRWGLTGSPAANGLLDLFGQCYMLDQGKALGQYVTHYKATYFLPGPDGFTWHLKAGCADLIYEKIKPLVLRLAADDYVDMPELIEINKYFDLPKKIKALYDTLEKELVLKLKEKTVVAANSAVASMKCKQVANGGVYCDPELELLLKETPFKAQKTREVLELHDEKTDLLEDLVEELQGSPLLVAYEFNHDLARIQKRFKGVPPSRQGRGARRAAVEIVAKWNRGEIPLLLGHPASMGHGLNLQGAGVPRVLV